MTQAKRSRFCRGRFAYSNRDVSITRSGAGAPDHSDKACADFVTEPPNDLVVKFLGKVLTGQQEHEVVGNFVTLDMKPHAAGGNVGNEAVAR